MNKHLEKARIESDRNWRTENDDYARTIHRARCKVANGNSVALQVKTRIYLNEGNEKITAVY